jgi:predicted transposase YbfD/YdcC
MTKGAIAVRDVLVATLAKEIEGAKEIREAKGIKECSKVIRVHWDAADCLGWRLTVNGEGR